MQSRDILERLRRGGDARQYRNLATLTSTVKRALSRKNDIFMLEPCKEGDILAYFVRELTPQGKPIHECTAKYFWAAIINVEGGANHVRIEKKRSITFFENRVSQLYFMWPGYDLVELTAKIRGDV